MESDLLEGGSQAARLIFGRFAGRLAALAQARLAPGLRGKLDPEDVTQSVFRTFFRRQDAGEFAFDSWDGVWSLLAVLTVRRCHFWRVHFAARRRDVRRETRASDDQAAFDWNLLDRDPTAEEAAVHTETVSALLAGLSTRDREIVERRLCGDTFPEISEGMGVSERTAQRVLCRMQVRLRALTSARP